MDRVNREIDLNTVEEVTYKVPTYKMNRRLDVPTPSRTNYRFTNWRRNIWKSYWMAFIRIF